MSKVEEILAECKAGREEIEVVEMTMPDGVVSHWLQSEAMGWEVGITKSTYVSLTFEPRLRDAVETLREGLINELALHKSEVEGVTVESLIPQATEYVDGLLFQILQPEPTGETERKANEKTPDNS